MVATNAKASEHSNQKQMERTDAHFGFGKPQSILKPVLGATSLQRKIVESAVNEKIQQRTSLLVDTHGLHRYTKMAPDVRDPAFFDPREQIYHGEQQLIHRTHTTDREMMQHMAKSRRQQYPLQGTQP